VKALAAGCRFFAGYPITPATEVADPLSRRLPEIGASIFRWKTKSPRWRPFLGASWGGVKSMTSNRARDFADDGKHRPRHLHGIRLRRLQRSARRPQQRVCHAVAQGDMMQARWGSHGHYEIIALVSVKPARRCSTSPSGPLT
jgi:2-oxoglutarate ferredoxin oxidoreductase subunit alpha